MRTIGSRARVVTLVCSLLLFVGVPLINAGPASAYCGGAGREEVFGEGSPTWGAESASSGTCNGDKIYAGWVGDQLSDGSCVWVQFLDGGSTYTQATSCNTSGTTYTFWDQTNDTSSSTRLCRNQGCGSWLSTFGY